MTVYIVVITDGDESWVDYVYDTQDKAEGRIEALKKLDESIGYYNGLFEYQIIKKEVF